MKNDDSEGGTAKLHNRISSSRNSGEDRMIITEEDAARSTVHLKPVTVYTFS